MKTTTTILTMALATIWVVVSGVLVVLASGVNPDRLPDVVEQVRRAVVMIEVERPQEQVDPKVPLYKRRPVGPCSGVIIDPKGYILTTHYNIDQAKRVRVRLDNGATCDARVLGWHEDKDLAVLKIEARGLPTLPIADAEQLQVGDAVALVGRGPGGEPSVAPGIVSATKRGGDTIQTDCAANFSSAGGAVVTMDCSLVGVAVSVHHNARWGYNSGISFAALLSKAETKSLIEEMKQGKRVSRPPRARLGVHSSESEPEREGALIGDVDPGSAADRAGILKDDIIITMNGQKIRNWDDLAREVQKHKPGDDFTIVLVRKGQEVTVKGKLGKY